MNPIQPPIGAWPAHVTEGPSLTVFELPVSRRRAGLNVAGKAVNFGPDGILFDVPITISVPVDATANLTGHHLRVFEYHPSSSTTPEAWTEKDMPQGFTVPDQPSILKSVTNSFSVYVAVKIANSAASQEAPDVIVGEQTLVSSNGTPAAGENVKEKCGASHFPLLVSVAVFPPLPLSVSVPPSPAPLFSPTATIPATLSSPVSSLFSLPFTQDTHTHIHT